MASAARYIRMFEYGMILLRHHPSEMNHGNHSTLKRHERSSRGNRLVLRITAVCVGLLAALVSACASPKVGYDYDRGADFTAYRTYEWMPDSRSPAGDKRIDNDLVDARIRAAVDGQLRQKGYTNPAAGRPDFYVSYQAAVTDMMKGASTQRYIGDRASGLYTTVSDVHPYKDGALLVDIVDGATQKLVWQGTASAEIDPALTARERDERIARVVKAMFDHFPP
ncbi:conserved protein of unknown function [Nitrospira japonica]|uniref:DUF4136 domain-containing protein n=1 Tax=Nitrospira japonica TaxID=1325564 RepID=A0A1W1I7Z8_9BACT|nr:DUF4136 domain-containing protein [Nitrospira japonica]SLM48933.1 conserved protein of unknown function [Nitrospira japonica]